MSKQPTNKNPDELTRASRGVRIQKAMARAGVASRRDCEALVEAGRVRVNGQPVRELPAWVDSTDDRIEVDGQRIAKAGKGSRAAGPHKPVYLMVNKPKRVISTNEDPAGRKRVIDLVDVPLNQRLFPVGRLDAQSTGLILLTNDGELANELTHPRYGVTKQYQVTVRGRVAEADLGRLRKGLMLTTDPRPEPAAKSNTPADQSPPQAQGVRRAKRASMESVHIIRTEKDHQHGDRTLLDVRLREGRNREIRRLLAHLGFKVRRLHRTTLGPLKLKGVPIGGWRQLTPGEVKQLRNAVK